MVMTFKAWLHSSGKPCFRQNCIAKSAWAAKTTFCSCAEKEKFKKAKERSLFFSSNQYLTELNACFITEKASKSRYRGWLWCVLQVFGLCYCVGGEPQPGKQTKWMRFLLDCIYWYDGKRYVVHYLTFFLDLSGSQLFSKDPFNGWSGWALQDDTLWLMQGGNADAVDSAALTAAVNHQQHVSAGRLTQSWNITIFFLSHICNAATAGLLTVKCLPIQKIKMKACMPLCSMLSVHWQQVKKKEERNSHCSSV